MMFGFADDWTVLIPLCAIMWPLIGPFLMLFLGSACARARGRARKVALICTAGIPCVALGLPIASLFSRDAPSTHDIVGFLIVEVLLVTVLPWSLSYGVASWRVKRAESSR